MAEVVVLAVEAVDAAAVGQSACPAAYGLRAELLWMPFVKKMLPAGCPDA
jgi:hypothetical protein